MKKKSRSSDTINENIQAGYRNGIWDEKYAPMIMKKRKRIKMEGREQPKSGEKENS